MNPKYPIYIVSKGRAASRFTMRELDRMQVPYRVVIEPQEYESYSAVINPSQLLTLPFANLGQGSIPARNWVWDHAISEGYARHWILDDNILNFSRLNQHKRPKPADGEGFRRIEEFVDQYFNVALAGMQYQGFAKQGSLDRAWSKPVVANTRVYSCILILNEIPFRWRGRYNEDTDLSLRVLKAGWATLLFYAFLCNKATTMTVAGGNTEELYQQTKHFDGRLEMAKSLQRQHPDVTTITKKFGHWQHQVNYKPFSQNRVIRKRAIDA